MTIEDYLADQASRFAAVAMTDTNGLLRGQMVSIGSLKGIARNGMGMSPAQLALDPTDVMLTIPGVNDDKGDFHDDPLQVDPSSVGAPPALVEARPRPARPVQLHRRVGRRSARARS
jgi:glutamine synthetase